MEQNHTARGSLDIITAVSRAAGDGVRRGQNGRTRADVVIVTAGC
jgi:hypothetical protein